MKNDREKIFKRLEYLWNNEVLERCCISVTAPKYPESPYTSTPPQTRDELKKWYFDGEWLLKRNIERIEKTYYAGDALPTIFPYFGTGGHAKYICDESKIEYQPGTIWIHSSIDDYMSYNYDFDPQNNKMFQDELKVISYLASEANDRYFVGMPDNCGSYDALSQLRGNANLLMDFITNPDEVKYAASKLVDILKLSGDYFFQAVKENCKGGSVQGWMNTWSPKRHMQLQCDLSVMISNEIYNDFIKEELTATSSWLDNSIYHFDGMEQIRHLDTLLSIEKINMIQWTQVAGQPPVTEFIPQLRKIQQAGKGLVLILSKHQLKDILDNLSIKGLNLVVNNAASPDEADSIVDFVKKYHD